MYDVGLHSHPTMEEVEKNKRSSDDHSRNHVCNCAKCKSCISIISLDLRVDHEALQHLIATAERLLNALEQFATLPETLADSLLNLPNSLSLVQNSLYTVQTLMGDAFMVCRCLAKLAHAHLLIECCG